MSFLKRFFGIRKKTNQVLTHIDPDIEENKIIKEQAEKLKSLEGQISNYKAKKRHKESENKNFLEELDLIKELEDKSETIERKKVEGAFNLNRIDTLLKKNKKLRIELTDKDDIKVFDYFKSFVILPNTNIGIKGESGEIWASGPTLNHIISKPEAIKNHIRRKRIPLPYDENYQYIPDLEKLQMNEIKYDEETETFRESEELIKPVKEMIMDREKRIITLLDDKEYLEEINASLSKNLTKIERKFNVLKTQSNIENSELSNTIGSLLTISKKLGSVTRNSNVLSEENLALNEIKEKYETIFKDIIEDMEDDKKKTALRRAKDELQRDLSFADSFGKKTIIQNVSQIEEPVKPNQPLKPR